MQDTNEMQTTHSNSSIECLALNINDRNTGSKKANVRIILEYSITGILRTTKFKALEQTLWIDCQRRFVLLNRTLQVQI